MPCGFGLGCVCCVSVRDYCWLCVCMFERRVNVYVSRVCVYVLKYCHRTTSSFVCVRVGKGYVCVYVYVYVCVCVGVLTLASKPNGL